ncbi:MAG TPA: hypothetical protein PL131_04740 [Methylotenera sp.]|nr:hypothetical protein [Methylotenera sp.]HPN00525.1 hypothetical protein [Methylotenera sp.]
MAVREMGVKKLLPELEKDIKFSGIRHPRMLSEPGESSITFDVATTGAKKQRLRTIDLNSITFAGYGDNSVFQEPIPFSRFPYIKETVWYALNETLKRHNVSSNITNEINGVIPFLTCLYSYLFRHGIYRLEHVTQDDVKTWLIDFIEHDGWWNLLGMGQALEKLIVDAKKDPPLRIFLSSEYKKERGFFSFNKTSVSWLLGLPLQGFHFGDIQRKLHSEIFPELAIEGSGLGGNNTRGKMTSQVLYTVFRKLNFYTTQFPEGVDQIGFIPIPEPMGMAKKFAKARTQERTANITPEYAVKLVTVAFDWVYTKSPGVIELLTIARKEAEVHAKKGNSRSASKSNVRWAVDNHYQAIKEQYGFEWDSITLEGKGEAGDSLNDLLAVVQYAAFTLIGINHGRRKNELIGEGDKPYGLYLGCVSVIEQQVEFDLKKINIYVEKTYQQWKEFWCNKLVYDSVSMLESIYQLFRPLNTPPIRISNFEEAKEHKLIRRRVLTDVPEWADKSNWVEKFKRVEYGQDSRPFFRLVDPESSVLSQKSHPNRRLFACLYHYRYEFSELLALRDHLVHNDTLMTHKYVTDPDTRKLAETMQEAWKNEQDGFDKVMDEVQREYFRDTLIQIIKGECVGGRWPRLVSKRLKTLAKDADFVALSDEDKASLLTEKLTRKGYKANPKSNGICFSGSNKSSARLANCHSSEGLNQQNASPSMCHGCVHLFTNQNYLSVMEEELAELGGRSKDFRLPMPVRIQAEKQFSDLTKMIQLEREMGQDNQRYLAQNIQNWTDSGIAND